MPRALTTALAALLILAAAAAFWHQRTAPLAPVVLPAAGPVRLLGNDPWFHARHGWLGAQGELRRFDPQADFPRGLRTVHVGGFDALLARVAQGAEGREAAFARFAWVPPALGVLCLLGVAAAAGWAGGAGGAVLAAGLLLGWPGDYGNRANLGFVDHHVAEPLLGLAALALLAVWLARERPPGPWALAAVVALWLLLLTWAGAPLWIGVLGLAVLAQVWGEIPEDGGVAQRAALWATLAAAGYAIVGARWPNVPLMGPLVAPSVAALGGAATALGVWSKWGRKLSPSSRRGALVALAGIALAGAWLWPATGVYLQGLLTPRSGLVAEHEAVTWAGLWAAVGPTAALAPLGLLRERARPLAVGALALTGLWALTHDQAYAVPPALALAAGAGVGALSRARAPWVPWAVAAVAAGLWVAAPPPRTLPTVANDVLRTAAWTGALAALDQGDAAPAPGPVDMDLAGRPAVLADWQRGHLVAALTGRPVLASHTPSERAARFWLATDEAAALADLCADCGPGERVGHVIVDGATAGPELPIHLALTERDGADLVIRSAPVAALDGARFVVPGAGWRRTLAARLWLDGGAGLGRLRLVWQSPQRQLLIWRGVAALGETVATALALDLTPELAPLVAPLTGPDAHALPTANGIYLPGIVGPAVRVFEVVPGARVVGTAAPNAAVTLALRVRPAPGAEPLVWRQDTQADARGDFLFRAPYPTGPVPGSAVAADGQYVLLVGGRPVGRVSVSEAAVQAADTVLLK